ncbi:MAG TPA: efflux transporter outer membrane subunit [Ideonella sp.]|uniref:efflux transporter outer membrane subunit n=1 Tax=Ideonella sp. TaxID=1929293 RepID=UPI002E311947|nr:efflux transporter outer membrane subunit [Ideonella sp.]HEX5682404.1 efflux transporter outer membrane subunit [Ideonella sp.]
MSRHLFVQRAAAGPLLLSAALLAGCINLAPGYERPGLPVPGVLPAGAATGDALPAINELLRDERLRKVVQQTLANNRDLRVAMLNIERSRAQLRLADADRWPTVAAAINAARAPSTTTDDQVNTFQAGLQVTSYELDLFGRVRNVSGSAAANLLATEAGSRAARLALVSQVVATWFTLAADQEQLALARQTLAGREQTLKLSELRVNVGAASDVELHGTRGLLAQAQASVAQLERLAAQDANALALLVGQPVTADSLPTAGAPLSTDALAAVPAGASSELLLRRPDVIQAEQTLIAANANIGAARAAMFPRITLSGSAGVVSDTLRGLVESGTFAWTLAGNAALAIFDAGRNQANVKVAEVNRDIAVAQYEKAIQSAFRETADALVAQATWRDQVSAQQTLQTGERERLRLTRMRYEGGAANLIELLDSERSLAAADQALVLARLGELLNRLALYKALGGEERAAS